jgi:hypothetical protein
MFIGVREGTLYMLQGKPIHDLVHECDNICDIWNKRLGNLHYKEFLILRAIITCIP